MGSDGAPVERGRQACKFADLDIYAKTGAETLLRLAWLRRTGHAPTTSVAALIFDLLFSIFVFIAV